MPKKLKIFLSKNYLLIAVLLLALFLRLFRLNELLGFWYDQGRDALIIWDMIYGGKFTLIGAQMGFTGIFSGGWFYWLLSPFYYLGHGNPIWPTVFLIFTSVFAIYVLYKLGEELGGRKAGLLAAFTAAVSFYVISASRWLSDPTPALVISVLVVWAVFKFLQKKIWAVPAIGFLVGMSLQFEAATEIFYIPAIIIIFLMNKKILPKIKVFIFSLILFLIPAIPQVIFEMRHPGVLSGAITNFIFHENTFTFSFWEIIKTRMSYYYQLFSSKFWINGYWVFAPFFIAFIASLVVNWKKFWKNDKFKAVLIFSIAPFIGTLFFVGNLGAIYDYYFTGYYLLWILLFSFVLTWVSKNFLGKLVPIIFLIVLSFESLIAFKGAYLVSLDDPTITTFDGQLKVVDWIYKDAGEKDFNFDVYVPPVVPYEWTYLFRWYGNSTYGRLPVEKNIPLLYTVYQVDAYHPERLGAWLERQKGIGSVVNEERFGGIIVQKRERKLYVK